jgi:hypothetical protein
VQQRRDRKAYLRGHLARVAALELSIGQQRQLPPAVDRPAFGHRGESTVRAFGVPDSAAPVKTEVA